MNHCPCLDVGLLVGDAIAGAVRRRRRARTDEMGWNGMERTIGCSLFGHGTEGRTIMVAETRGGRASR